MKTTLASWLALALAACGPLQGQVPAHYKTRAMLHGDKGVLQVLLSGDSITRVGERDDLVTPFQMESVRNGQANDVQLIGQAPESHLDRFGGRVWDAGPLVMFTPATNFWVQGMGFYFIQTNHLLYISNNVETRVLRSLLKTSMLSGAKTNEPATPGQILKIFADGPVIFDYQINLARYCRHVHVIDSQLDLTSDRLAIQLTTNSAIQTILAEDNVVMKTTNIGWAASPRAFYCVTNASEMTELSGGAVWHNGDEQAKADKFIYDSTRHLLTAMGQVRVWWPNGPQRPGVAPATNAAGYRELWADFATLQMPATNGPVESMHARGDVTIVNQADRSRATGDQADYTRTNDLFVLTGSAVWWNDDMEIKGQTLTAEATNNFYHARGGSNLKRKVTGSAHTNQWLHIASRDIDYQTNLAVFTGHVKARLLDDGALRETLTCDKLDVELFSNEIKTAVARGHVQGETAPDKSGHIDTIACDKLTMHRSPATQLMTGIVAENDVILRQFGTIMTDAHDQLSADVVTAYFSAVTNQLERAVATRNVVIDQIKTNQTIHATGERAVYTAAADEVKITGQPVASTDRYIISNCDFIIWRPKTNYFGASGAYTMLPVKAAAAKSSF